MTPALPNSDEALLDWLQEKVEHQGLTTRQIADVSGIYDGGYDADYSGRRMSPTQRALYDLEDLTRRGKVKRVRGVRPSRWEPVAPRPNTRGGG